MKTNLNLLPWSYRRDHVLRRCLRQWCGTWAAVAALLTCGWWVERSACRAVLADVESKQQSYEGVKQLRSDIAKLTAMQKGLGNQENLLGTLQSVPPPLLVVALVSQSAQHCQGRVMVRQLIYQQAATNPGTVALQASIAQPVITSPPGVIQTPLDAQRRESASLSLRGIGTDNVAVAQFVVGLRESGVFQHVDLKSAAENESARTHTTAYQVECRF
jgi:hypothetical protein